MLATCYEQRFADATPYPLPAGSRLRQELSFLAFTREQVVIIMPTKTPRGRPLTRAQTTAHRRIARRRVHIDHVNSTVKRCRIVHDTCRLPAGGRPRSAHRRGLGLAALSRAVDPMATDDVIGMNFMESR